MGVVSFSFQSGNFGVNKVCDVAMVTISYNFMMAPGSDIIKQSGVMLVMSQIQVVCQKYVSMA